MLLLNKGVIFFSGRGMFFFFFLLLKGLQGYMAFIESTMEYHFYKHWQMNFLALRIWLVFTVHLRSVHSTWTFFFIQQPNTGGKLRHKSQHK